MKKLRRYPRVKPTKSELAERAPVWQSRRSERNLFLRGVSDYAIQLAREFAVKHGMTLSQVFEEAARHLPEIEHQHEQQLAEQRKWLDELMEHNKKQGLPELPKGTVVKLIREYRDE